MQVSAKRSESATKSLLRMGYWEGEYGRLVFLENFSNVLDLKELTFGNTYNIWESVRLDKSTPERNKTDSRCDVLMKSRSATMKSSFRDY